MNLRQLEMFLAVVENGGYAKAAKVLHVAHSAIHRQVRMLGEELSDPLLYRSGQRTHLTEGGKICVDLARRMSADISKSQRYIRELNELQGGSLRIGTGPTLLCYFVLPILRQFLKKFPRVETYVMTGTTDVLLSQLGSDHLDVDVLSTPLDLAKEGSLVESKSIYEYEYVLAFSERHSLANKKSISIPLLRGLPFIMPPRASSIRRMLDRVLKNADIAPDVIMELDSQEAMIKMVQLNMGVTFLPRLRPAGRGVRYCSFPGQRIHCDIVLVYPRSGYLLPTLRTFQELCCQYGRSLAASHETHMVAATAED